MKRPFAILAASLVLASASAQDAGKPPVQGGMMGPMMQGPMPAQMQEHMKQMREQMAQMRAATDPKERERLMQEHIKSMEQAWSGMPGMMGCGKI